MTPVSPCLIKVSLKTMLRICILAATKESYPALSQATAPSAALHLTRYLQQLALPSPNVEWDIMHTARSVSSAMKLLTDLAVCMISHLTSSANRGKSVVGILPGPARHSPDFCSTVPSATYWRQAESH